MNLRRKMFLALVVISLIGTVGMWRFSDWILKIGFEEIEVETMRGTVLWGVDDIIDLALIMDSSTAPIAAWDDMYEYMETRDIGFVENLFSDAVLQRNKFNLVVVYSETGDIVYGKYYDYESDTEQIVPAAFRQDFTYNALKNYDPDTSSVTGIINNQGQPIIIASRPIIDTSETAPSKGTLVLGLDFSLDEIEPIQDHSGLPLEYHDPDSDAIPSQVRAELSIDNPFTYIINPDSVTGFYLVEDVFGDSGLIVSVSQPREDIWLVRA